MNAALAAALLLVASGAEYPICTVVEDVPGVFVDISCVDANVYRGRRFCGEKEGSTPGGLLTDYDFPFRYVLLTDQCAPGDTTGADGWCINTRITGRADYKDVAREPEPDGVAYATGLIRRAWEPFVDGVEPLDEFNTSSCIFSFTPAGNRDLPLSRIEYINP